jgi:hypothetical protein
MWKNPECAGIIWGILTSHTIHFGYTIFSGEMGKVWHGKMPLYCNSGTFPGLRQDATDDNIERDKQINSHGCIFTGVMLTVPLPPLNFLIQQYTLQQPMKPHSMQHSHSKVQRYFPDNHRWPLVYSRMPLNINGRIIINALKIFQLKSIYSKYGTG